MATPPPARRDVLITGASGVIGSAIARQLVGKGINLHLTSRQVSKLEPLTRELAAQARVATYPLDLSDTRQARKTVDEFFKQSEKPFALVCNAGNMGALGAFAETDFYTWSRSITENFFAHAAMIHRFAEQFKAHELWDGSIVVLSGAGVGGDGSFANMTAYSTAKAALVHLVEALAPELSPLGIAINAVAPGPVVSGMTTQALNAGKRAGEQAQKAKECKDKGGVPPTLAAEAVEFLLGPDGQKLTGRLLSARFDIPTVRADFTRVQNDSNLYRLRRIDGELFEKKTP